jgi:hypothetical protein
VTNLREFLAGTISGIVNNIGLIASAEPDKEKREALIQTLAEGAIEGLQDCKKRMDGTLYPHENAEIDAVALMLKKAYFPKH